MLTELQLKHAAFDLWVAAEGEDNHVDLERAKRALPIILTECVMEKQRTYIMHYFVDQMNMQEIAEMYGVSRPTVSRVIRIGIKNAYSYLRFVSPLFMNAPPLKSYLKNGKKVVRRKMGSHGT